MKFYFHVEGPEGEFEVNPEILDRFEKFIGIDHIIPKRYSRAFLIDLYCHEKIYGICPEEVLEAIKEEETGKKTLGIKQSTPFRKLPLKGLWHKHYYSPRFIGHNLANELANGKVKDIVHGFFEPHLGKPAKKEMFEKLSQRIVKGSLDERKAKSKMTGEWIVFAKHQNQNYYLCMATHNNGDVEIRNKIDLICCKEFEFLNDLLSPIG